MLYRTYEASSTLARLSLASAAATGSLIGAFNPLLAASPTARRMRAARKTFTGMQLTHERPDFDIAPPAVGVGVAEVVVDSTPFCDLRRFVTPGADRRPPVIVVAPLSGHFATLVRDTISGLLAAHDVYVTDWANARDVPVADGRFGLDEYVDHLIRFLDRFGGAAHMLALCQSTVPALVATAVMSQAGSDATPRSLSLMAGPVDTRRSPTEVNTYAAAKPIGWFEQNLIDTVPHKYGGRGRQVYPGFLQIGSFVAMNPKRHRDAHREIFRGLARGDDLEVARAQDFYAEYFAVLDLTAEFYLETVERVFQRHDLPLGQMTHHGRIVDPAAIERTWLLTVEGEKDDICGLGQTRAALDLCTNVEPSRARHHVQEGAGHYSVFSGRRWREGILPQVASLIADSTAADSTTVTTGAS